MTAVSLTDLPPAPPGRSGWPWTEAGQVSTHPAGSRRWPRISIVTPSFNQGEFLEETIRSVLLQGYPNLEYVIIDGGSTDGSREIIENYAPWLSYWISEPDRGQYDGLNKGFARTSGEIMAWLNSDDKYAPNAFTAIGEIFSQLPAVEWVTSIRPIRWGADGRRRWCRTLPGYSHEAFRRAEYVVGVGHFSTGWIQQESTFWRRALWQAGGGRLDDSLQMAGDFDLWARFYDHASLYGVACRLGGFRQHSDQKTATDLPLYVREAKAVFTRSGGRPHGRLKALLRKCVTRLPAGSRKILARVGLAFPAQIIVPDPERGWRIESTAV